MTVPRPWTQKRSIVEPAQEWRQRHNHDCAKTNEVTHGIIDENVDLEALALEYRFLDRGSTLPILRPTTAAGSGVERTLEPGPRAAPMPVYARHGSLV